MFRNILHGALLATIMGIITAACDHKAAPAPAPAPVPASTPAPPPPNLASAKVNVVGLWSDSENNILFVSVRNMGLFASMDGGRTWQERSAGIRDPKKAVFSFAADPKRGILYGAGNDGVYVSTNKGQDWTRWSEGLPFEGSLLRALVRRLAVDPASGNVYGLVSQDGFGVWKRGLGDDKWAAVGEHLTGAALATDLAWSATEGCLYVSSGFAPVIPLDSFKPEVGVMRVVPRKDKHEWKIMAPPPGIKDTHAQCVAVETSGKLYSCFTDGLWESTGGSWTRTISVEQPYLAVLDSATAGRMAVVANDGVHVRENGGAAWKMAARNWPEGAELNSVVFYKGRLFLGTNAGLFSSPDLGATWVREDLAAKDGKTSF